MNRTIIIQEPIYWDLLTSARDFGISLTGRIVNILEAHVKLPETEDKHLDPDIDETYPEVRITIPVYPRLANEIRSDYPDLTFNEAVDEILAIELGYPSERALECLDEFIDPYYFD